MSESHSVASVTSHYYSHTHTLLLPLPVLTIAGAGRTFLFNRQFTLPVVVSDWTEREREQEKVKGSGTPSGKCSLSCRVSLAVKVLWRFRQREPRDPSSDVLELRRVLCVLRAMDPLAGALLIWTQIKERETGLNGSNFKTGLSWLTIARAFADAELWRHEQQQQQQELQQREGER